MTVYAGVIPAGALHVVTGSAHDIISARGGMDAGQFSEGHQNIYTQQFDHRMGGRWLISLYHSTRPALRQQEAGLSYI